MTRWVPRNTCWPRRITTQVPRDTLPGTHQPAVRMGESAQVIVPRRRAHDAKLSPRAHICDGRRLHPCRAARHCVALNSFLATSLTSPPLPDSTQRVPCDGSPIHVLGYPYDLRVPLSHTHVCDGLVQSLQRSRARPRARLEQSRSDPPRAR
jgi:hypothetical protein